MMSRRRLIILGSTGSIGVSALDVVDHLNRAESSDATSRHAFEVMGLAAGGGNAEMLAAQARRFNVRHIAIADAASAATLRGIDHVYRGPDSALELIEAIAQPGDLVLGAMVGAAGIPATIAALQRGCDLALANKETLVAAGAIVLPLARKHHAAILPVDSEHSAVFQCLEALNDSTGVAEGSGRADSRSSSHAALSRSSLRSSIRKIVLTASGGPFRTWTVDQMQRATVDQALNHPTWSMGRKITIDSASLMNKALEIMEAHWLFDLPAEKIEVIIHPQSIVHSFVELIDGSVLAQLGPPDMKLPIQYALTWPRRVEGCAKRMDWATLRHFDFEPVDHERFPAVRIAWEAIRLGGTAGAILNAANEAAVAAFLDGRIPFPQIVRHVSAALRELAINPVTTIDDVMKADRAARAFIDEHVGVASRVAEAARERLAAPTALRA